MEEPSPRIISRERLLSAEAPEVGLMASGPRRINRMVRIIPAQASWVEDQKVSEGPDFGEEGKGSTCKGANQNVS